MEPVEVPSPTSGKGSYCTHMALRAAEKWKSLEGSPVTAQLNQHFQLSLLSLPGCPWPGTCSPCGVWGGV